jgi:hypothetical protein
MQCVGKANRREDDDVYEEAEREEHIIGPHKDIVLVVPDNEGFNQRQHTAQSLNVDGYLQNSYLR